MAPEGKLIYEQIPKVMRSVGAIGKGRQTTEQGRYWFRGIDDIYNAIQPALIEHGVFVVPRVVDRLREERPKANGGVLAFTTLTVEHEVFAADGSSVKVVTVGEAMDSGDKSSNKAMSAAMKYALIELFAIPTEGDNDTENHSPEPAARQQQQQQQQQQNSPTNGPGRPAAATTAATGKPAGIKDADAFRADVQKAFAARGFSPAQMVEAAKAIAANFKAETLAAIDPAERPKILKGIADGLLDKFKAPPAPPATPAAAPPTKATPDQVTEAHELVSRAVGLPDGTVERWLGAADVESFEEMPADKLQKCIEALRKYVPATPAASAA